MHNYTKIKGLELGKITWSTYMRHSVIAENSPVNLGILEAQHQKMGSWLD